MRKSSFKNKIICMFICSLLLCECSYAGYFFWDVDGKKKYMDDQGKVAIGWRWLDLNSDNICECYRFGADGAIATTSRIRGKDVNKDGVWVVDGVVQQIYKSTGLPLKETNAALAKHDNNKYIDLGTLSQTKRINATKKDMKALILKDMDADDEARRRAALGPKGEFVPSDEGYIVSRGATSKLKRKVPIATYSDSGIILKALIEDEVKYLSATESIVAGRDARKFVSTSNKYTAKVDNAKIYGGDVWSDCICLQGNGASVKFTLKDSASNFKANYFTFEVAHQTHGESTADTYCAIELYLNGKSITSYDEFCDGEPELIEEWLDDGESNLELKAIITGDAPGRKIYIRNFRFRQIREKKDED